MYLLFLILSIVTADQTNFQTANVSDASVILTEKVQSKRIDQQLKALNATFVFLGGIGNNGTIELYRPGQKSAEQLNLTLAYPRYGHASMLLEDGRIVTVGGRHSISGRYLSRTEYLDMKYLSVKEGPPMQLRRHYASGAALANTAYVCGGLDRFQNFLSSCECLVGNQWQWIPSMTKGRYDLSMVSLGSILYTIGGATFWSKLQSVESYWQGSSRWSQAAPLPVPRLGMAVGELDGMLVVCGGFDGHKILRLCEHYDRRTDRWTVIAELNKPRNYAKMVSADGKLFIFGGKSKKVEGTVEMFDYKIGEWILLDDVISDRFKHSVVALK